MGDRGNILIGGVYLYTHWDGSDIKRILQRALKRESRWQDQAYLTRIIFCEMIGTEQELKNDIGYGIATYEPDNEHPILEVNTDDQTVKEGDKVWTFGQFINLNLEVETK